MFSAKTGDNDPRHSDFSEEAISRRTGSICDSILHCLRMKTTDRIARGLAEKHYKGANALGLTGVEPQKNTTKCDEAEEPAVARNERAIES